MAVSRGRGDLAAQLAKQPPAKKAAILVAILAVLGFLYWQFFYSGMTESRDNEKVVRNRLQKEQQKLDRDVRLMKKLKAEHEKLKKGIEAIQLALPSEAELPSFIDHLQVKAGDAGVNFKSWGREKEVPIAKYIKVPMKVKVSGNFHQLMHYFHLLGPGQTDAKQRQVEEETGIAERRPAERIVTIENLTIGNADVKNEEVILTAQFLASTFRQEAAKKPPAKKTAQEAAKDKPKGGKGQVKDAKKKREEAVEKKSGEGAGDKGIKALTKPGSGAPVNPL